MKTIKTIYKNKRFALLLTLFFLFEIPSFLQAQNLRCANEIFNTTQLQDSAFLHYLQTLQSSSNTRLNGNVLEIPVVVHVLHNGEPVGTGSNITDAQVYDAVRGANERWKNIGGDGVDMEVQFCMSQFDPNGNPSNGIVRKDASAIPLYTEKGIGYIEAALIGETGADEAQVKNLSNWPHDYAYNIWVVNKIAGGWGGYSIFPLWYQYPTDGVVITANSMRYSSSTLAHEIGHGMGLFHTFQGSSETTCTANANCSLQGDQVCDTPPHKKEECTSSVCNNSPDSMLSFKNIMSYCGGRGIFTEGQKTRVRNTILNSTRKFLLRSYACIGPPCDTARTNLNITTCDASIPVIHYDTLQTSKGCDSIVKTTATIIAAPTADFSFLVGNNSQVSFINTSVNANIYLWNFGDDSISTLLSPTHTYANPGTYIVSLTARNICADDSTDKTVTIAITTTVKHTNSVADLVIYPNPSNGNFNLKFDVSTNNTYFLEVINTLGQVAEQHVLAVGKEHAISLTNNLPKGIYKVQLIKKGEIIGSRSVNIY